MLSELLKTFHTTKMYMYTLELTNDIHSRTWDLHVGLEE